MKKIENKTQKDTDKGLWLFFFSFCFGLFYIIFSTNPSIGIAWIIFSGILYLKNEN